MSEARRDVQSQVNREQGNTDHDARTPLSKSGQGILFNNSNGYTILEQRESKNES